MINLKKCSKPQNNSSPGNIYTSTRIAKRIKSKHSHHQQTHYNSCNHNIYVGWQWANKSNQRAPVFRFPLQSQIPPKNHTPSPTRPPPSTCNPQASLRGFPKALVRRKTFGVGHFKKNNLPPQNQVEESSTIGRPVKYEVFVTQGITHCYRPCFPTNFTASSLSR